MTEAEAAWLDYAYDMMTRPGSVCTCEPYTLEGFRWPGFIGSAYRGILFVGARHNAKGLRAAGMNVGPLSRYAAELRTWISRPRDPDLQQRVVVERPLLDAMRSAYRHCFPLWAKHGSPLAVFAAIKDCLGTWDDFAFVNLARCYMPETGTGEDDLHICAHCDSWSLDQIVDTLKPKIVFVSKDNAEIRPKLPITVDDSGIPLVVRFSNYGTGKKNGESFEKWVPRESATWKTFL